jgi:hypothetical protein
MTGGVQNADFSRGPSSRCWCVCDLLDCAKGRKRRKRMNKNLDLVAALKPIENVLPVALSLVWDAIRGRGRRIG